MPIWGGNQDKGGWAGLHIHRCDFFERTARQALGAGLDFASGHRENELWP